MEQRFIQSFINAADSVLGSVLRDSVTVVELASAHETTIFLAHPELSAATVRIEGDIEGCIMLAVAPDAARSLSAKIGVEIGDSEVMGELANMVVGNAVARLNDSGYRFFVHPPQLHSSRLAAPADDAVCLRLESGGDTVHMSIAMRCASQPVLSRNS